MFKQQKELLRKELKSTCSIILISFDLWTSPNVHVIIGVVGHFVNKDGRCCHVVLRLREIIGEYTGENMAGILIDLFRDYGIAGNIRYFMANNAELNDMCINTILYALYLNMSAKLCKGCRLYCFGHITNLYA